MKNKIIFSVIFIFFLLLSCEKVKSQTPSNEDRTNLEIKRNNIIFEFRGFKWNSHKDEIIVNEGIPKERIDGYIVYGDQVSTRETTITYYNKNILNTINANKLEYTFIDNKLMKASYNINLLNPEEIKRNFDSIKDNDVFPMEKKEVIELFYFLRSKLNELYILLDDMNGEYFLRIYNDKNDLPFFNAPCETKFGAQQTDIEISLIPLERNNTFWIKISYEYSRYYALHSQIYDEEKLKYERNNNSL
jgi:hypothetical protein